MRWANTKKRSVQKTNMVLYHRILSPASPEPNAIPLVVLHGLLGSSDNWQTLAGHWARTRPVVLIDQRNHGRSPHHPSHSYPDMVVDLLDTLDALGLDQVHLLGHSMGGKTAMHFADRHPQRCARLIIADMAPVAYPPHHTPLFDALAALDLTAHNRRTEIDKALALEVREPGIRQFLL
jgi:esterase